MATPDILQRYQTVSRELASLYRELAKIKSAIVTDWDDAYQQAVSEGLAYNPAAARGKSAIRRWSLEELKLIGDIDAALIELRCLDQLLKFGA